MSRITSARPNLAAVAALAAFFMIPGLLLAQDPVAVEAVATANETNVGQRGAEVMGRLDVALKENRRYGEMLLSASPEDSLVLELQRAKARDSILETIGELVDVMTSAGENGGDEELLARGKIVLAAASSPVWAIIEELKTDIDRLRATRGTTAPADQWILEDKLALLTGHLDRFLKFSWTHIGNLESFGLDAAANRDSLGIILEERADALSGRLSLAALRIRDLSARLKESPNDADLIALRLAARKNLHTNTTSQKATLNVMDEAGMPTTRYRAQLVTMRQDLTSGLMDAKVAARLAQDAWGGIRNWLRKDGPRFMVKIIVFLVIIVAGRFLANIGRKVVEKSLAGTRVNMSNLLKRLTVSFAGNAILVLSLVLGLAELGLSLGPLLAGFGVVGFILGFAMQDSLSNLAAGMMILINRPYDVGDLVEISGVFGRVGNMSLVSTSVLTMDNQTLLVPNSKIWGDVIKNVTDQKLRRVDMTFGISYSDDIPHAEEVLHAILKDHPRVLDDPEPVVRLHALNDSSVDFVVRPWVKTSDYWDVFWDVTRSVKIRFDEEGISIPFPQRDVHVYQEEKPPRRRRKKTPAPAEQGPTPMSGQDEPGETDVSDESEDT